MRPTRRQRRGFSLVEVMVYTTILVMLASSVAFYLYQAGVLFRAMSQDGANMRDAQVTMSRVRRELQLAFLTANDSSPNTYRTVFVSSDDNPDRIWFTSRSHQRLYRDSRECDQTEITIWTEDMPDGTPGEMLLHREAPRIDEEPAEGGVVYPIAENVKEFDLRFLDPETGEWRSEWNSEGIDTPKRLPRAVEIGLTTYVRDPMKGNLDPSDTDGWIEKTYVNTVVLMYADGMKLTGTAPEGTDK